MKLVDNKLENQHVPTCIKPVDNLQQTCYHQARASDANASWYQLDDCEATSLQQTGCDLLWYLLVFLCQGWSSAYSIESVIVQISATLVKGKARINFKENEKVS